MPKRKTREKIDHYRNKIKKLQCRRIIYTSSSSEDEDDKVEQHMDCSPAAHDPDILEPEHYNEELTLEPSKEPLVPENQTDEPTEPLQPEIDPDMLSALGESTDDSPEFGDKIHENLSKLWLPLLKKGMAKERKDNIQKEYLIPENCRLLQAPKMNVEISAAVPDMVRNRDKGIAAMQQQLGTGISAINRAMDIMIKADADTDKLKAMKHLSNSCRILCDVHAQMTQNRTKLITPSLDKTFLQVIQDAERDETVFGVKLSEKIKAAKTIERQGLQIKKIASKIPTTGQPTNNRQYYSGNWTAPPRFTSNRGGARKVPQAGAAEHPSNDRSSAAGEASQRVQDACTDTVVQRPPSPAHGTYPGCREALQQAFSQRGSPPEAMTLMLASLSDSTLKQYNGTYQLWWQFCNENGTNIFEPSKTAILSFLTKQFSKNCTYGTLNSHRSALSLLLGNNVGSDDCVKRVLKGAYKQKPSIPKYNNTWDPQIVLNHISHWYPNKSLNLERITKKLVTLLALCTGHRVQTLSLIKIENIVISNNDIKIGITDIIKTSAAGREPPVLFLPAFRDNVSICPATTFRDYIFLTKNKRVASSGKLLLTYKPPHRAATSQTISRWIKEVLSASGVDITVYSAHSSRHAATSAARRAGVSIDTIRRTAGWTETSTSFARFYNRPISDEGSFARAVVLPNNDSL